jgi:predicted enzyme related to lactoylglutathione lyase
LNHHQINYLEIPVLDLIATKKFFSAVFDWRFTDYGPESCSFDNAVVDGGFYVSIKIASVANGSVLVVLYSDDLTQSMADIEAHGGVIVKPIFSFPGAKRFCFNDPNSNEFSRWQPS